MSHPAIQLYGYQQRYLLDKARFKIAMFARQTGKSFTTTLEVVDDVYQAMADGRRERWVILSRGERQAREAFREGVMRHAQAYNLGAREIETSYRGDDGTYNQLEAEFPGGSRIIALPANPDTARGYSANVFLDEFAIHQDSREIWGALFPVISAGYRIRIASTPKGRKNKFYELWTTDKGAWSRHQVDIHQAVADGLPRNIDELRENLGDEELWRQEFLLEFIDEATAYLPWDLINSCEHVLAGDPDRYEGGECVVGVDIGRHKDLFVIQVLEAVGDVWWHREEIALQRASFAQQDEALDQIMTRYSVSLCQMDKTGIGEKPVEDAQRRYGARVQGVQFSQASKLRMASASKRAFEDRRVRIPSGHDDLRNDLHKIKREPGTGETPRFTADRDAGGHADRAWSMFLALDAAMAPRQAAAGATVAATAGGFTPSRGNRASEGMFGRIKERPRQRPQERAQRSGAISARKGTQTRTQGGPERSGEG
jgi:phage FluMu gp28-like protein